jgi:hypothetical protein
MRKVKTIVLKLDFRKAFDMGSWDCLLDVLRARGFDHRRIQIKKGLPPFPLALHYPSWCSPKCHPKLLSTWKAQALPSPRANLPCNLICWWYAYFDSRIYQSNSAAEINPWGVLCNYGFADKLHQVHLCPYKFRGGGTESYFQYLGLPGCHLSSDISRNPPIWFKTLTCGPFSHF